MVRTATVEDAGDVAAIYLGGRKQCVAFAPLAHTDAEVREWIRQVLIPEGGVRVLEHAGSIVAMMAVSKSGSVGWIDQLYVRPDRLSCGFGTVLVDLAKRELGSPIQLYTFEANHLSRRFYERHGFIAVELSDGSSNEERCPDVLYRWEANESRSGD